MKAKHVLSVALAISICVTIYTNSPGSVVVLLVLWSLYVLDRMLIERAAEEEMIKLMDRVYTLEQNSVSKDQVKEFNQFMMGMKLSRK